uniref:hypothetical protein n=1 Tax=Alistipes sp. TaxID=1872444 RepID=UPI004055A381
MRSLVLILSFAMALVGCATEEGAEQPLQGATAKSVFATFEQPDTRTYIDTEHRIHWHEEDAISLFRGTDINTRYVFEGQTGDTEGSFAMADIDIISGVKLERNYALYPYTSNTTITREGRVHYTLPKSQGYAVGTFASGCNVMMAFTETTNDDRLSFRNCGGYLRLQLYGTETTIRSITLRGNNNEPIAGGAILIATDEETPAVIMDVTATATLALDCGEGVRLSSDPGHPTEFWLVLPPTLFTEGFAITLEDAAGLKVVKSTSKRVAIERNVIQPMAPIEVSFDEAGLTFGKMAGVWRLDSWRGTTPSFEVYMDIQEDGTVELWQRIESREWSYYASHATLTGDVISGVYTDGVEWGASYGVTLDSTEMTWQSTADTSDISRYTRATLPEGIDAKLSETRSNGTSCEPRYL